MPTFDEARHLTPHEAHSREENRLLVYRHAPALSGADWHALALTGTHWHSLALTDTHWHSLALTGTHWDLLALTGAGRLYMLTVINCHKLS